MPSTARISLTALVVLWLTSISGFAQATIQEQCKLKGKVVDQNGGAIVGAQVVVTGKGAFSASTVTDRTGEFSLQVTPGNYSISAAGKGFTDASQAAIVRSGETMNVAIVLEIGGLSGTVTVTDMSGYQTSAVSSATKTLTPLLDVPQSITVMSREIIKDQSMQSIGDVVRYVPGITAIQGENNRDQVVIRGNSSSADFFLDGVRDDVQYYRDLYNLERLEALKGPNAMIFGRGGGGGVINRVTKQAGFVATRELDLQAGSFGNKRVTADLDQPFGQKFAFRINGLYENSRSFRDRVGLERFGVNPTVTFNVGQQTQLRIGYEHFRDNRVADRGIPSFQGRPSDADVSTFFGDPDQSKVRAAVNLVSAVFEHQTGNLNIRNRTLFGHYDRFYQNFVPGTVNADETRVNLSAYNNATQRRNIFNQTDLNYELRIGSTRHTILGGAELGHQRSDNLRNTGFFNNVSTVISVPFADPRTTIPVTFRQNATDANNRVVANVAAAYAQDQIELNRKLQVLVGIRFDRFDLNFHNNRNGVSLQRTDRLVSPRVGVVFKPISMLSLYSSYSVSYLPSSGDQFSSLTSVTQTLKPEKFNNYEAGVKWDLRPSLSLSAAAYRLDRTNTRATAPDDPTRIVQTGSQRTNGVELGINGSVTRNWKILGGYAYQDAKVTSATISAPKGARVAQVPRNTFSLWNNYRLLEKWAIGLGIIHRSDMYAAIDNRVTLPGYTRVDAALSYSISERMSIQANLENVLNRKYFVNADSNDNISPGSPRAIRVGFAWRF